MGRWTDVVPWVGPIGNSGDGDGTPGEPEDRMSGHVGVVIHTAEGSYSGTDSWQRNPAAQVGSHFLTAKDGRAEQLIDTDDRSWCQSSGNSTWISIENEGFGSRGESLSAQQVETCARILAKANQVYGVPLQVSNSPSTPGLGWHGMGGSSWGGHYDCPGDAIKAQMPAIVARAAEIANGKAPAAAMTTLREDPDGVYVFTRMDAVANVLDLYPAPSAEQGHGVPLTALLKELRDNGRWAYPRLEALLHMLDTFGPGPEKGKPVELVAAIKRIEAALSTAAQPSPVAMTDADRQAIADLVTAKLVDRLAPLIDLAERIGRPVALATTSAETTPAS